MVSNQARLINYWTDIIERLLQRIQAVFTITCSLGLQVKVQLSQGSSFTCSTSLRFSVHCSKMAKRFRVSDVLVALEESSENSSESDAADSDEEISTISSESDKDTENTSDEEEIPGEWQKMKGHVNNFSQFPFTVSNPGLQLLGANIPVGELAFLQLFLTDQVLTEIVVQTNAYAAAQLEFRPVRQHSIWTKWHDVTLDEMKAYLGVILNMALNEKQNIVNYFSKEWLDTMPFFGDVFQRKRFLQIHWMLHISPPTVNPGPVSRANKVHNVLNYVRDKCLELFIPGQNIAIDESTIAFKGRIAFKMYNPQKPTKWGIRVFTLADSDTGYVATFEPYYGNETTQRLIRPDLPFTSKIVLHLCTELLQKSNGDGYHLFTDRYYTGCQLAMELLDLKIHLTVTIQKNRQGLPVEAKQKKNEATGSSGICTRSKTYVSHVAG
jgi:hypothetical protein